MKHTLKITILLLSLFLLAQLVGLVVVQKYLNPDKLLPFNIEKPTYNEQTSYVPIVIAIAIGTVLALVLAKFKAVKVWKFWFFLSVMFTMLIAFFAFMNEWYALILAVILALWKIFKPNPVVHNFTELFVYAGLAAIFVPVLNLWSATILLIIISLYDAWAVWQSKHMIKLAEFQTDSKLFAGLSVSYSRNKDSTKSSNKSKSTAKKVSVSKAIKSDVQSNRKIAIIGGGDVAFALLFAGAILKSTSNLGVAFVVSIFATLGLLGLLLYSKKDRYYPAMPFITAGCFIGWLIIKLFGF
jgi:presenilin-like A22 family membrane protease